MKNVVIFLIVAGTFSASVNAAETLPNLQNGVFIDLVDTSTTSTHMLCSEIFKMADCVKDIN